MFCPFKENPMDMSLSLPKGATTPTVASPQDSALRKQAAALEASFLSEMLSHAGLGKTEGSFAGGIGEEQFSSFLRQEQANMMVAKGGIGLAEQLFQALSKGNTHGS
jgi:peptidoglycan hydrolase FlgJ